MKYNSRVWWILKSMFPRYLDYLGLDSRKCLLQDGDCRGEKCGQVCTGGQISHKEVKSQFLWQFFFHHLSSKLWMLKVHWRVWAQPGAGLLQESGAGRAGGRPRGPWLALPGKAKVLDRQEIGRCKLPHFRLLDSPPATCFWSSTPSQVFFLFKELVSISEKFIWLKFSVRSKTKSWFEDSRTKSLIMVKKRTFEKNED